MEDKGSVEDSKDGKCKLIAASGDEDSKSSSVLDDVDKVTKGTYARILKIGAWKLL